MAVSTRRLAFDHSHETESARTLIWSEAIAQTKNLSLTILHLQLSLVFEVDELVYLGRRSEDADTITIDFEPFGAIEMGVSRKHAILYWDQGCLLVVDNTSLNRTWLNGQILLPNKAYPLYKGDRLKLGALTLQVDFVPVP